jgi:hypothetical protein
MTQRKKTIVPEIKESTKIVKTKKQLINSIVSKKNQRKVFIRKSKNLLR